MQGERRASRRKACSNRQTWCAVVRNEGRLWPMEMEKKREKMGDKNKEAEEEESERK
jgi:hypothetical protein